eukprot:978186-Rhodomonas_salina.1
MLVHGTCNPTGEKAGYSGVYLSADDISRIVSHKELVGKPVLVEHGGNKVGSVISAWEHDGRLDVVVSLPRDSFDSCIAGAFVSSECLKDFSLGYKVQMSDLGNENGSLKTGKKTMVELSLVKTGARSNCHIKNFVY